ncbi:uncharacterized protein LOC108733300 isoform X1 [Agrilus planipennis]|uniref:Uncharacterized protein LOC108733300 isoform X1 n=1 Tax=Agrilus planipennis TaxID=224129 RepID=A0A1W4W730_AGRPL|nr:uncharacterized protein LOC108733300 isoform X1 [Agrilus planipennis]
MCREAKGLSLLALFSSSLILNTIAYAYPNQQSERNFIPARVPQLPSERIERKFAEKPNAIKKVALSDIDDIQNNSIESSGGGGFSWSNIFGMVMQMLFNPGGSQGPNKSEGLNDGLAPSPWANLLSVGLKLLTAFLGGGAAGGDGIDKVDNGGSQTQGIIAAILSTLMGARNPDQVSTIAKQAGEFFNIVVDLLEALQTSFSHRSRNARNFGKKDTMSDAAVAGISMMKGYVRSMSTADSKCAQKYMCDANRECSTDIGQGSIFCHLGAYAASFLMQQTTGNSFDILYEAGRRGRSGDDCQQAFLECNEV